MVFNTEFSPEFATNHSAETTSQSDETEPNANPDTPSSAVVEKVAAEVEALESETAIDNGLGVQLRHKTLYHGSGTPGIQAFTTAENSTVGEGVYLTSGTTEAWGYASRRSNPNKGANPVLYEVLIDEAKLVDLRQDENVQRITQGFRPLLYAQLQQDMPWHRQHTIMNALETIDAGKIHAGNLRELGFSHGQMFTDFIKSLGYDGLVTFEGGEGDEVGSHDTYLIFDPEKISITRENSRGSD